jgi:hypothetical protein
MKITYKQLIKLLENLQMEEVSAILRWLFSFEYNFDVFCYYLFEEEITSKIPQFHREIYKEFLFSKDEFVAMAAPRGHAKSTLVGLFYITWLLLYDKERYIVYTSQSHSKTVQFIEPLTKTFKDNKKLKFIYGDLTPKRTLDDDGKMREDIIDINGIRVQGASFEKNIRGFKYGSARPSLIIMDDIEDDERVLNPVLRLKDMNKVNKIIIPSLDPECGRIRMIGTILHWDSVLANKIKQFNSRIYKACELDDNGNVIESTILWPEYYTIEKLLERKMSMGSVAFSSEMLNNPIQNEASLIKYSWIKKGFDETLSYGEVKEGHQRKMGVDFAFGDRATNDNSAFVGVEKREKYYLIQNTTKKGMSITEQFDLIARYNSQYKYQEVILEENSIKGMSKELYNYDFNYYLIWTGANDPADKLKPSPDFEKKRHTVGKKNMILRLATMFENDMIVMPYKTEQDKEKTNRLAEELMTFALEDGKLVEVGVHADIPIALAMALERLGEEDILIMF